MQELKIHQPIIDAVIVCLKAIFEEHKVADKEVNFYLKQHKSFGSRDRSIIAETVYDIVRWKLRYQFLAEQLELTSYKSLLLISFLHRNYILKNPEILGVPADTLEKMTEMLQRPVAEPDIEQSYPKAFYDFCLKGIGEGWHALAAALNQKPGVFIRVNTLKTSKEKLMDVLTQQQIQFNTPLNPFTGMESTHVIQILSKNNLKNSDLYKQGWFEFQDIGSQAIGTFLFDSIDDKTNIQRLTILDLCAGAGGKTLHLSALLNNNGKIYATDYNPARLKNLARRAIQAGCRNIELLDYKTAGQLKNIDIILMDAPCSGTGTFKRQADLKYKVTEEKVLEYQAIQASILNEHKKLLNKNGKIIYATCSVLPQENELQIQDFINNNPEFRLVKSQQLLPNEYDGDGFYMAEIKRK